MLHVLQESNLHQHSLGTGGETTGVRVLARHLVVLDLLQLLCIGLVGVLFVLCNHLRHVGVVAGGHVVRGASVEGPRHANFVSQSVLPFRSVPPNVSVSA